MKFTNLSADVQRAALLAIAGNTNERAAVENATSTIAGRFALVDAVDRNDDLRTALAELASMTTTAEPSERSPLDISADGAADAARVAREHNARRDAGRKSTASPWSLVRG